jgi:rod shape-determining protein MreD
MVVSLFSRSLRWIGGRLPFLLALIAVIFAIIPFRLPGNLEMTPLYPLMVVFFWGNHRGDLMTPGPIFFTGLLYDLLSGAPPGLWALILLLCHGLALILRDTFGRMLYSAWMVFAVTCSAACLLAWLLGSLYDWELMNPVPFAVQGIVSIALYPFFGFAFAFIERRVIAPTRA